MTELEIHENLIEITKYTIDGKLPDPFLFDDGTRVATKEDWVRRREEMYKTVIELQYGTMPPKPEFVEVEPMYLGGRPSVYRVTSGTRAHPVSFNMYLFNPLCCIKKPCYSI